MSVKLSSYVWDGCAAAGMKISKVAIMARLADFSNDEGVCWPSVTTIARQIGAGESTVRTALAELETDGWLSKKARRAGNRNASNVYQLNVAKLKAAAHASESDTSKSDGSKSDGSKSDGSKFDGSESGNNGTFDPPESGGDPSVKSTPDPSSKKPTCQPPMATDPEVEITDQAKDVLKHLNLITGSRYQTSKSSLENIRARLKEQFTVAELKLTVDYLHAKWAADLDMAEYLRPTTLFQPTKFPGYLEGASRWHAHGRPVRKDGKWVKASGELLTGDTTLRDKAYMRFIGSGLPVRNPTPLETMVSNEASKLGLRGMGKGFGVSKWNAIWKECSQRMSGEKAA
ncbi:TPA: conserved phage C-terminal domain-containing protein [Yersinia enterocolitica]|uniref:conserved phage C-terminal domain-containing protein n=1 Tax=Yersinia enterocolitica TaxID=630 RepID=UPI0028140750|nr:conserved phage C-terminal domain-containing protein [Yersinia enterocolitica]EKN6097357.1 GntR family transcriptional regulator [Yersinia enterocolitica]HDL7024610.1 conserved phage C-terminal domain-containing protein [Yersinia enterocolitica]HDL7890220.1 conserved phage C-terminal domain-containing protein [Yersinia enterocolitica]HDM8317117.1 conserved phage C-terminal domain-containing protein [Yersinia enterocolitica]